MATPVGQYLCKAVSSGGWCCFCPFHSWSTAAGGMDGEEMKKLLRQELGWEFNDRKKLKEISDNVSTTGEVVCLRHRRSASVVSGCCPHTRTATSRAADDIGGDKTKELLRRERGREPGQEQLAWEISKRTKHKETSYDVSTTALCRCRRSSSLVCYCCPNLLDGTSSSPVGIDGGVKVKMPSLQRKLSRELLGHELAWKHEEIITGGVSTIVGEIVGLCSLSFPSVLCCCCTPLLHETSNTATGIEEHDEIKKLLQNCGEKLGRELGQDQQDPESSWKFNARKKHEAIINCDISTNEEMVHERCLRTVSEAYCCCQHWLNLTFSADHDGIKEIDENTRTEDDENISSEVTTLNEKNRAKISGSASTSGDDASLADHANLVDHADLADHGDSLAYTITHAQGDDISDAVDVAATGEVVGEEIVDPGGDGMIADNVVARETVDVGDDGDPIVLGVIFPAEYRELVSNVCLKLPLIDADYYLDE